MYSNYIVFWLEKNGKIKIVFKFNIFSITFFTFYHTQIYIFSHIKSIGYYLFNISSHVVEFPTNIHKQELLCGRNKTTCDE